MAIVNQDFYIFPEEVYRVGNSASPKMSALRVGEINIYELKGVKIVIANGKDQRIYLERFKGRAVNWICMEV